jgi:isopenicillin N synthase-like dioxygenase
VIGGFNASEVIKNKYYMQNIPSVDLRDFLSDDPKRKQKFVNEIGSAFEDIGFVALKGHF